MAEFVNCNEKVIDFFSCKEDTEFVNCIEGEIELLVAVKKFLIDVPI